MNTLLTAQIEEIIEKIVEDARGKWSSHQEEADGISNYAVHLANLIYSTSLKNYNPHHELDLEFVRANGGISQDNEHEGD